MIDPSLPPEVAAELTRPYELAPETVAAYRRDGFVRLRDVLAPAALAAFAPEFDRLVAAAQPAPKPMAERTTYERAFLQVFNLWRESARAAAFVLAPRLAGIAAALMGCATVRLYHDQALYKEPGGGHTPWHCDQVYWPLEDDRTGTLWVPLQDVTPEMGPMGFAPGGQALTDGRDLVIGDESETRLARLLADRAYRTDEPPYVLGGATFHSGWVFHRAGPNLSDRPRRAMTVIYMAGDMRLAEPKSPYQRHDARTWCPGAEVDAVIATDLNPEIRPALGGATRM